MVENKNSKNIPLSGLRLIEASAGTGKTHKIIELFIRLILEKELTIDQILVVTYTEAATEELRDRIRTKLRDEKIRLNNENNSAKNHEKITRLQNAIINFDEAAIFTIHGFCFRILKEQAYESSSLFDTELITDQGHLLLETVDDFWRKNFYTASPTFAKYALHEKHSSESLCNLVSRHLQNPLLKIIPEIKEPEIKASEDAFIQAYTEAADCWNQNSNEIEKILVSAKSLNRSSYKTKNIPEWVNRFNNYFSSNTHSVILPEKLEKLALSAINNKPVGGNKPPEHSFFELCETLIEKKDILVDTFKEKLLVLEASLFSYARNALEQKKTHHNVLYFDDLLLNVYKILYSNQGTFFADSIRKKYKAALIDEFQDTDPVQYKIFSKLFDTSLFLIGDPKQAIYSFRNADLFAYLEVAEKAGAPFTLNKNWRSESDLIHAVNLLFSSHKNPFLYKGIDFKKVDSALDKKDTFKINNCAEPPFQLWFVPTDKKPGKQSKITKPKLWKDISDAVAAEISRLLVLAGSEKACINDRPVCPDDIAILVRENKQAGFIQESLKKCSIPSILHSTGNVFNTPEAIQLIYLLEAAANPRDERTVKAALATDILGVKGEQLFSSDINTAFLETEMADFQRYHDLWSSQGFFPMFQQLLIDKEIKPRLISFSEGERKLTNILHLAELTHNHLTQENLGMAEAVKWLFEQVQTEINKQDEEQLRLETDRNAVKIVTIHKSKGLEYPIVFCPFLWDGQDRPGKTTAVFHDSNKALTLDLGSDSIEENKKLSAQEDLSESMRLLYVALTRARNRCYLVWGGFKDAGTSPLSYLFHNKDCTGPKGAVQSTKKLFDSLGDEDIFKTLRSYENLSEKTIQTSLLPHSNNNRKTSSLSEQKPDLSCRSFDKQVYREMSFTSFSSIISGRHQESDLPEADEFFHDIVEEVAKDALSIFNFPAGAVPGTMLHEVLENLDFTSTDEDYIDQLISDKFVNYGFEEKWVPIVTKMIQDLLETPLDPKDKDLRLSQIKKSDRLNELGFYFPISNLSKQNLNSFFSKCGQNRCLSDFAKGIDKLTFSPLNGFMKGFIDLVFTFKGKFYLIDWKSNLLGKDPGYYKAENLIPIMQNDYYILQYHLYTLALHKYLKNRLPNYDYEKDFGGIFYIFLRGISKTKGPDYGIFRDRPQKKLILEMEKELTEQ